MGLRLWHFSAHLAASILPAHLCGCSVMTFQHYDHTVHAGLRFVVKNSVGQQGMQSVGRMLLPRAEVL